MFVVLEHILNGGERRGAIPPTAESSGFPCAQIMSRYELFDECNMVKYLESAGFKNVRVADPFHSRSKIMQNETTVKYPTISLVVEGTK